MTDEDLHHNGNDREERRSGRRDRRAASLAVQNADRIDSTEHEAFITRRLLDIAFWALVVVIVGLGVLSALALRNAAKVNRAGQELARVERSDRDAQRSVAYRMCARNRVDRAFAHSRIMLRDKQLSRVLMGPEFIPILNCEPNLEGRGARPLSVAEQVRFVQRFERGELTVSERGYCPTKPVTEKC